jgi:pimeloyl-ACP methyl ester carboxylesterase
VADPGRQVLALDLPGHGGSPPPRRYDLDSVLAAVHEAVRWTRLDAPVVVGHAMAAVIATVYAARYPARGVVNVNQWLRAEPPAAGGTWVADEIRGGGFAADRRLRGDGWQLPYRPDGRPPDALAVDIHAELAKIGAAEIDYLFIAACEVEAGYRRWLRRLVPQASIEVFPGSGHLPHLDRPERFASCLATMGRWPGGA